MKDFLYRVLFTAILVGGWGYFVARTYPSIQVTEKKEDVSDGKEKKTTSADGASPLSSSLEKAKNGVEPSRPKESPPTKPRPEPPTESEKKEIIPHPGIPETKSAQEKTVAVSKRDQEKGFTREESLRFQHLSSEGKSRFIRVFEAREEKSPITSLAISAEWVAAGSESGKVVLWNLRDDTMSKTIFAHQKKVSDLVFSNDGKYLVTGGEDGNLIKWDVAKGSEYQRVECNGPVYSVDISANGMDLLAGSEDNNAHLWDDTQGKESLIDHQFPVRTVAFLYEKGMGLSYAQGMNHPRIKYDLKIWNLSSKKMEHQELFQGKLWVSPGGKTMAGWKEKNLLLFDWDEKKWKPFLPWEGEIAGAVFSENSDLLASWDEKGTVTLCHFPSRKIEPGFAPFVSAMPLKALLFSREAGKILASGTDGIVYLFSSTAN